MTKFKKYFDKEIMIDEKISFNSIDKIFESFKENKEKHGSSENISDKLHKNTATDISSSDQYHIRNYTRNYSHYLNKNLIKHNGKMPENPEENWQKETHELSKSSHNAILKNVKKANTEVHLYSATKFPFHKHLDKHNTFKSPAHLSMTHDERTLKDFATKGHSIIHVHIKPKDKILHVSKISFAPDEHETIIPAGTTLKYSHSTGKIHHFTIHSQD